MHNGKLNHAIHKIMDILQYVIVFITLAVLVGALALQVLDLVMHPAHALEDVGHFLHVILTIVVGLEFVHTLLDTTAANILHVLMVAIARHVVLSHEYPWSNIACVVCIVGLLAAHRYLTHKEAEKKAHAEEHA